ncbi:MAG: DctP family TRAP transporter solute-binding subunit [Rectinema subterraneum]|uniref:DctP family TRAP transporter solute-binding subunit n=1 Tax=Rectinema subterraneum TaxID=2653714 RepID=UPI003C7B424D
MKYCRYVLIAAALIAAVMPLAAFTPKKEYTMQVNVGPAYDWGVGAQKFADLVAEKTNGLINIKPYFGSSLLAGKQTNWYQAVADGSIDFVVDSTINASSVIRSLNLFSLPFFINTYENVDKIENGKAGARIIADLEKGGVKFLAWGENGFRQLTNSKREVKVPQDVAGLKVRVVGSPIFIDIFKQLGADSVNMNWADAVTAFQQGVVDGQENPKSVLTVVKIWEYHKYMTNWNYLIDPLVFGVNMQQWKNFPADVQKQIQDAATEAAEYEKALARAYLDGDKSLNILKTKFKVTQLPEEPFALAISKGMKITNLTPDQLAAFKEKTKPVYDKWVPMIGEDLYKLAVEDMK